MSRPNLDQFMMMLAMTASSRTTCIRRGVGCVLANERGHVLAVGYNGVAAGLLHCNESSRCTHGVLGVGKHAKPTTVISRLLSNNPHLVSKAVNFQVVENNPNTGEKDTMPGRKWVAFDFQPHRCAGWDLPPGEDKCEAVHAEANALLQCRNSWEIHTAYVTLSPCLPCAKLLLNTSCKRIVFAAEHTRLDARAIWQKTGREWILMPE